MIIHHNPRSPDNMANNNSWNSLETMFLKAHCKNPIKKFHKSSDSSKRPLYNDRRPIIILIKSKNIQNLVNKCHNLR